MEVKDAVKVAKRHIADLFADELPDEIGLEETELQRSASEWLITIGFRRKLPGKKLNKIVNKVVEQSRDERVYKVVRINDADGEILGVRDRILQDAA